MKPQPYKLSELAQGELRDFGKYTITSRAIPNMIDSLKPSQRFYLFSSLCNSRKDFDKCSAVGGIVSKYGYGHDPNSATAAGQLMAATWYNNICLIEGRGSFGTRLIQKAGSSRYTFSRISANFDKYVKDIEHSPVHKDPTHKPPAFYLPVIPLVLINGARGIATGFATNILPRSEKSVTDAVLEYIKKGKITGDIKVEFPDFTGTITYNSNTNRYLCKGKFHKISKTVLVIDEVPYGYDRETYVGILNELENNNLIVDYEDQTGKHGFRFSVKLKQQTSAKWSDKEIINRFKLSKSMSENLTVINQNDTLAEYDDPKDLIKDFVDFRMTILQTRIDHNIQVETELARWLNVKMQFIMAVLDNKIVFKGHKRKSVEEQILKHTDAIKEDLPRLLALNIMSLTHEQVLALQKQIAAAKRAIVYWQSTTPKKQYLKDITELEKA